jgi:site-specific recombinase XerD
MAGVSLPVVQRLLGHSTITTTMRYTHPTPESERSAVALLDKAAHDFGRLKLAGVASL